MPNRYSTPRVKGRTQTLGIEIEGMDRVKVALNGLDHALSDLRPLWPKWRDAFYAVEREAFSSEGASGKGGKWAPLTDAYDTWKKAKYPGRGLLVLEGALQQSLTGSGGGNVYRPGAKSMEIGSAVPYATYVAKKRPPIDPSIIQHKAFGTAMQDVGRELGALWAKGHR